MKTMFEDFLKGEEGAETLEYVIIAAIIIVLGAAAYATRLDPVLQTGVTALDAAVNTAVGN